MAVRVRGKRVVIDFRCDLPDGRRVRCVESEGSATERNIERADYKWRAIQYALKYGSFNYLDYFPYGSKAKHFKQGPEPMLFSSWWEHWIAGQAARPNTVRWWRSLYKSHFDEHFGSVLVQTITEHEVRVFRRHLLEVRGLQESSVNAIVKNLCQCLRKAKKEGLINFDPCEDISLLKTGKSLIAPFTFEELQHLITTARRKMPELEDMIILWSRTGLRPGEIFGLKWIDVDYFNEAIHIRRTMHNNGREGKPKTVRSERSITLRQPSIEALKRHEARTGLMGSYVFLNHKGKVIKATTFSHRWTHLLRMAGLSYRSMKQMRHTFATLHLAAGESVTWVARVLGHSSPKVTFDYYNAYVPNLTREDGSAFDRVMEAINGNNLVTMESKSLK